MKPLTNNNIDSPFTKGRQHRLKFQSILSETAELFNWQGSRATTLADIAGSMKLTKTCVYYYVKTKEDLIYQCYVASCEMWLARAQQAAALPGTGLDKIVEMVRAHFYQYIDTLNGQAPHFALLTEVSTLHQPHANDIGRRWADIFALCQLMVEQGIEEGVIERQDPAIITSGVFSVLQWFPVWLNRAHAVNPEPIIDGVMDLLVNGLSAQPHKFGAIEFPKLNSLATDSFDRDQQNRAKREAFYRMGSIYFNVKGYKGTSLDEIASSLAVTKGAFYYHIKNKEELLFQCFNRTLAVEGMLLAEADDCGENGLHKVELSLRYLFNVQFTGEGPLIRYRSLPSLDEDHRKAILKANRKNSAMLGTHIRQGFADHTLRKIDPEIAQHVLSGAVEASPDLADRVTGSDNHDLSAAYFHVFINGLSAKKDK